MTQRAPYLLHGADISYFSGKLRPALPQKSLWYREVQPNIAEIQRNTGVHYIPALVTPDGEWWQDTSDILDRLEALYPEPPLFPATPVQRVVAYLAELYGDEMGLLPAMHYRWSFEESVEKVKIDFSTPTGDPSGGAKFAEKMSGSLPFLGINDDSIPEIEAHTRALLDALCTHFGAHRFLLGDSMSLADLGLMGPLYAHLFRDAVPERLLYQTAFQVCAWIERMNRPPLDQRGWLEDDAIAPSLVDVLRIMADGVPLVLASAQATDAAGSGSALDDVPRIAGIVDSTYRGVPIQIAARPYTLWMLQRALDAYLALDAAGREAVDAAIAGTGWEPLLALRPRHRLTKRDSQLAWEA